MNSEDFRELVKWATVGAAAIILFPLTLALIVGRYVYEDMLGL